MSGDTYVRVKAILVGPTSDAVMLARIDDPRVEPFCIPKSLIHAFDLAQLCWERTTEIVAFRVFEWKAEELDL